MPLTRYVWVKKCVSLQTDLTSFLSTLRNVLNYKPSLPDWLFQTDLSAKTPYLVTTELSGIPEMTDYLSWRVQLYLDGTKPHETANITVGDISAYSYGDFWAVVFEQANRFSELLQSYANVVIKELLHNESPTTFFLPPNSILVQNDLVHIHSVDMEPLQVPLSPRPRLRESIEKFLRDSNATWLEVQANFPSYYRCKIGLEWNAKPSPETPACPRADEAKVSWPLFSQGRYAQMSYSTSAWLDLHTGNQPSVTFRCVDNAQAPLTILPFIGWLLLAMQESGFIAPAFSRTPLVKPPLCDLELHSTRDLGSFASALQQFERKVLWKHRWGTKGLRLCMEHVRAWNYPFAWWKIVGTHRNDDTPEYSLCEIVATLSAQKLIVNIISQPVPDRSAFKEFTVSLLNYLNNLGFEYDLRTGVMIVGQDQPHSSRDQASLEPPWEKIPDYRWHRKAVQLWHQGLLYKQIAQKLGVNEKTVRNELSRLRRTYGENVVPKSVQRQAK